VVDKKNKAKVYKMHEILAYKEKLATDFSEHCDALKELLLFCWDNNLKTRGCCTGHRTKAIFADGKLDVNVHQGYFALDVNDNELAQQIALRVLKNKKLMSFQANTFEKDYQAQDFYMAIAKLNSNGPKENCLLFYFPFRHNMAVANYTFTALLDAIKEALTITTPLKAESENEQKFLAGIDYVFKVNDKYFASVDYYPLKNHFRLIEETAKGRFKSEFNPKIACANTKSSISNQPLHDLS